MSTLLKIGKGLELPLELVTSTQAILARKRSGKSYTASVQAEELLSHGQQVAIIDPTSAWWGLKSSADGTGEGFPVVVFGGDHADAPLDWRAGKAMAVALVEHGFSCIFDLGNLETDEQITFVMAFCSEMLRINRHPIHIFMDEADTFAPQKTNGQLQQKCLGTVSRLVKQGGIKGVGFTMITQRPASINKDVLSQVDILTILRMGHPLDIKAATDWLKSEVSVEFAISVEKELPRLPVGVAFVASAALDLEWNGNVRTRKTFNSGATPKPGEDRPQPKVLAAIDIQKLGADIAASVKRAKEESPEYLKQRIAALESRKQEPSMEWLKQAQEQAAELTALREEVSELRKRDSRRIALVSRMREILSVFDDGEDVPTREPIKAADVIFSGESLRKTEAVFGKPERHALESINRQVAEPAANPEVKLRGKSMDMLAVCARMYPAPLTEAQVAMQSGMKRTSGTFGDYKSLLKTSGCVVIEDGMWKATAEGLRRAGVSVGKAPTTTQEVVDLWTSKLRGRSKDMLATLIVNGGISYERLAESVDMSAKSGTFGDYLSLLRTCGLIRTSNGYVYPDKEALFL